MNRWSASKGAGKAKVLLSVIMAVLLALAGCSRGGISGQPDSRQPVDGGQKKLRVVTTLFPYYDFVRQIAGDEVELTLVVPAGMDSHSFEPTPADMRTIQAADLLIYNGGAMEQWVTDVLDAIDTSDLRAVELMGYVDVVEEEIVEGMEDEAHDHDHGHSHDADAGSILEMQYDAAAGRIPEAKHDAAAGGSLDIEYDEHIWTSPVNAMKLTEAIRDALIEEDPSRQAKYREGADRFLDQLHEIDAGFRKVSADRKRSLIVVGDKFPFRYLAEEYGFNYRAAFSGCSTDTEPSARTIAYLIDKVQQEQIPVVYYLELSSHRVSEIIGEETGAKPILLHSCHNVTRAELEGGVTYVDLMKNNVENLRKGLDE